MANDRVAPLLLPGGRMPAKAQNSVRSTFTRTTLSRITEDAKDEEEELDATTLEVLTKKTAQHPEFLPECQQVGCRIAGRTMFRVELFAIKEPDGRLEKLDLVKGPKNIRGDQIFYAACEPGRVYFEFCGENHGFRPVKVTASFRQVERSPDGTSYTVREVERTVHYPPLSAWSYATIHVPTGTGTTRPSKLNYVDVRERRNLQNQAEAFITQIYVQMYRAAFIIHGQHIMLHIRLPDASSFRLTIGNENTVMQLKILIAEYEDKTLLGYKLTHNGKPINDKRKLAFYNIKDGDMIACEKINGDYGPQIFTWTEEFTPDPQYEFVPFVFQLRCKDNVHPREQID